MLLLKKKTSMKNELMQVDLCDEERIIESIIWWCVQCLFLLSFALKYQVTLRRLPIMCWH